MCHSSYGLMPYNLVSCVINLYSLFVPFVHIVTEFFPSNFTLVLAQSLTVKIMHISDLLHISNYQWFVYQKSSTFLSLFLVIATHLCGPSVFLTHLCVSASLLRNISAIYSNTKVLFAKWLSL